MSNEQSVDERINYASFERHCSQIYEAINKVDPTLSHYHREKILRFTEWGFELPYIQFPSHWKVKAVPAFNGLMVRYRITGPNLKDNDHVSVYLDCYNKAGSMPWPYWEMYGGLVEDCCRCKWDNIEGEDGFLAILRKRLGEEEEAPKNDQGKKIENYARSIQLRHANILSKEYRNITDLPIEFSNLIIDIIFELVTFGVRGGFSENVDKRS